jgi:hypothetical protein
LKRCQNERYIAVTCNQDSLHVRRIPVWYFSVTMESSLLKKKVNCDITFLHLKTSAVRSYLQEKLSSEIYMEPDQYGRTKQDELLQNGHH